MGGGAKPQVVPHGQRAFTLFPKFYWCDLEKKNPKIEILFENMMGGGAKPQVVPHGLRAFTGIRTKGLLLRP